MWGSGSSCPVSGNSSSPPDQNHPAEGGCPMKGKDSKDKPSPDASAAASSLPDSCPMRANEGGKASGYKNPDVYNVYNQKIDPTNQMPASANQQPAPGQRGLLPIEREASTIPKGGTEDTWLYPSPQMFWNALVRKNKTEGALEEDMVDVIRIHNNMNEKTWGKVMQWEQLRPSHGEGKDPKLLRFLGRPHDLSPKAVFKTWLGWPAPFDRHDWYVDRGGKEVRYVIDYYHDEAGAGKDKTPQSKNDLTSVKSILLDVRPALDSMGAVVDRFVRMPMERLLGTNHFEPLPLLPSKESRSAEDMFAQKIKRTFQAVQQNCVREKDLLTACQNDSECTQASLALQHCTAKVICPQRAMDFSRALEATPHVQKDTEFAYEAMLKCLELFELDLKSVMNKK